LQGSAAVGWAAKPLEVFYTEHGAECCARGSGACPHVLFLFIVYTFFVIGQATGSLQSGTL